MVIMLQEIPEEGLDLQYSEPPERFGFSRASFPDDISVSLHLTKEGDEVLVRGQIRARESLQCSRCLVEVGHPIQIDFQTGYAPMAQMPRDDEVQLHKEDLDIVFYRGDGIELTDLIRGQILLTRPMRSLCKAECRGLCQVCGQDLNVGACSCVLDVPDPRFAALLQFKRVLKKKRL